MYKPVVVIAGEDRNDRLCLRTLLETFCPRVKGRLVEVNDAARLRNASESELRGRVRSLARLVKARAAREHADVACVFVQEDFDGVDGSGYTAVRDRVQRALSAEFGSAHYVLATWEIEAWLLLFPDAFASMVQSWSVPARYRGTDTGMLREPKEILMHHVGREPRRYRVSDAPAVFDRVVSLDLVDRPAGTNRSWSDLRDESRACCATHLPAQRGQRGTS